MRFLPSLACHAVMEEWECLCSGLASFPLCCLSTTTTKKKSTQSTPYAVFKQDQASQICSNSTIEVLYIKAVVMEFEVLEIHKDTKGTEN